MFQYFPTNYVWSLAVAIALESGGRIGEIDEICKPLLEVATQGDDAGTAAFFAAWCAMGDRLINLAGEDEALGRRLSAGTKQLRASLYYLIAERMQRFDDAPRKHVYGKALAAFQHGVSAAGHACTRVEIPYRDAHIAGLFLLPEGATDRIPCMLHVNGLDSTKELLYFDGLAQSLARRGVGSLLIDQPGTGEALRLHGLPAVVDSERWATPMLDYLQGRAEIDPARIGICGVSLGGYYAPRAVAFEPRFALGAVWGANHDWGAVQRRRLAREGDRPVPHYWDHVKWVWGAADMDAFFRISDQVTLEGVLDRVRVPFLVTHGQGDRQIPVDYARQTFAGLVNSPDRLLKIFTPREGGVEHVSLDNMSFGADFIADWVAETFAAPG